MAETERLPIREAAQRLGISADTVRRRLKSGELAGERQQTPQGFIWLVDVPASAGGEPATPSAASRPVLEPEPEREELGILRERLAGLERLVGELQTERDAWREQSQRADDANRELRILVQQAQTLARALPAPAADDDGDASQMEPAPAGVWQRLRRRLGWA